MSVEENKAIVRRGVEEVWNKGNLELAGESRAPNFVFHAPGQDIKDPEVLKQQVTMFRTAFPDLHLTIDHIVAEGDMVAVFLTRRGTFKGEVGGIAPTGKEFTDKNVTLFRFEGGKQVETWVYDDRLTMYQQLGISPPMG